MLAIALAAVLCLVLHVSSFAVAGHAAGVTVREVALGWGPVLARIGKLRLRPVPVSGYVRFKDARAEPLEPGDTADAFDHQPLGVQLAITLSGSLLLLVLALSMLGADGLFAFASAFGQVIEGALSPLGAAQHLLAAGSAFAQAQPFALTLGLVAAKLAAVNLLPLPALNGGQALALVFGRFVQAPAALVKGLLLGSAALMASWMVALGWFALRALHVA